MLPRDDGAVPGDIIHNCVRRRTFLRLPWGCRLPCQHGIGHMQLSPPSHYQCISAALPRKPDNVKPPGLCLLSHPTAPRCLSTPVPPCVCCAGVTPNDMFHHAVQFLTMFAAAAYR